EAAHFGREFVRERKRLAAAIETSNAVPVGAPQTREPAEQRHGTRHAARATASFHLRDGRRYVTRDTGFTDAIERTAASDLPVLIEGETGTGKELVAHLIHELGGRRIRPFVVVDCSTLPESIFESELFGAMRGAFTGSSETREGIVAQAD